VAGGHPGPSCGQGNGAWHQVGRSFTPGRPGKSTFGRAHFRPTEVISSDFCRGLVADDENDQAATPEAFELLHYIVGKRLKAGRLTVVDATNVQPDACKQLVALAREHDVLPVAIVLDVPEAVCVARNAARPDRDFGTHVIRRQHDQLRRSLKGLQREGFRTVHTLRGAEEIAGACVVRTKLYNDLRHESGPFDVVGDIHGCRAELELLLAELGYEITRDGGGCATGAHRDDRRVVFVGDLVDRAAHRERPHAWHLDLADRLVAADPELVAPTRRIAVDTTVPASVDAGTGWWSELTAGGSEGIVVKSAGNLTRGRKGLVVPAYGNVH
jgi:predicted kinase